MTARVAIFAPSPLGGLAEHAHYQAQALTAEGIEVTLLGQEDFLGGRRGDYSFVPLFPKLGGGRGKVAKALNLLRRYNLLRKYLERNSFDLLLLESFAEYLAPFWAGSLKRMARSGLMIAANLHDPIRDFQLGPGWWHRWSIRKAYEPLSFVLVHQAVPAEAGLPPSVVAYEVPVGIYHESCTLPNAVSAQKKLGVPVGKRVFLSFGFIRNNKNLDLFIRAMRRVDDVFLIVAGRNQSAKDKAVEYYFDLAKQCGVVERVKFVGDFIKDDLVPLYFAACDYVLLTYDSTFRSQSGVLNIAANYQKPVFASSGDSPLQDAVRKFGLGIFVAPDSEESITNGLGIDFDPAGCDWGGYFDYASWKTNVSPVLEALKDCKY